MWWNLHAVRYITVVEVLVADNVNAYQKNNKGAKTMGKTYRKDPLTSEDKLMELYDKLASQWARKVEASRNKL